MAAIADSTNSLLPEETVVVTGGAQGIGAAVVRRLSQSGANVAIIDIQDEAGASFAAELVGDGRRAAYFSCDVRSRDAVRAAMDDACKQLGPITALVNNAGVGARAPFLSLEDSSWERVIGTNLTGAFIVAQEAARKMSAVRRGAIVNVSSISAYLAHEGLTAYAVSKAGMLALTRMMAFELGPLGIRVNAIMPGTIATDFVSKMVGEEARKERLRRIPLTRFGTPEEVAGTVAFLLSAEAGYINGASLSIDGGILFSGIRE